MTRPFEEINFLTRSENRVTLLETLADGTHTERELIERTGISKVTVNRTLDAFLDRGWIKESDGAYTATRIGETLAIDYGRFRETMDVACHLGPVVDLLPVERMDFDLRLLADASISDPENHDVLQTVDRWVTLIRETDRLEIFSYRSGRTVLEPIYEELSAGSLEVEAILAPSELERIRADATLRELKRKAIEAGATYYVAADEPAKPYSYGLWDDLAAIVGYTEDSTPRVHMESRSEPVVEWLRTEYETVKADAEPLAAGDLAP